MDVETALFYFSTNVVGSKGGRMHAQSSMIKGVAFDGGPSI